jgi:hypothetical protein
VDGCKRQQRPIKSIAGRTLEVMFRPIRGRVSWKQSFRDNYITAQHRTQAVFESTILPAGLPTLDNSFHRDKHSRSLQRSETCVLSMLVPVQSTNSSAERALFLDMVLMPGGKFRMGSDRHYPEEAPAHDVSVDAFWIDRTPVTNKQFRKFVNETGYLTFAERKPEAKEYPGALPEMLKSRLSRLHSAATRGRSARLESMVEIQIRCELAASLRAALLDQRDG